MYQNAATLASIAVFVHYTCIFFDTRIISLIFVYEFKLRKVCMKDSLLSPESSCIDAFNIHSPFYHLYTPGIESPILFTTAEETKLAINTFARTKVEFRSVTVLVYEFMSNHIHFIASGEIDDILMFFTVYRRRLLRLFSSRGIVRDFSSFNVSFKTIMDLRSLRNAIVYVVRNGYVVNKSYTPFSYPWGTGRSLFTYLWSSEEEPTVSTRKLREIFSCRNVADLVDLKLYDGVVLPESICDIKLTHSLFRNAHQYMMMLSKNVEAYDDLALEIGEKNILSDEELFQKAAKLVKTRYSVNSVHDLGSQCRLDLARRLHYENNATNGQIRRILGLSQREVDSIFPLSSALK